MAHQNAWSLILTDKNDHNERSCLYATTVNILESIKPTDIYSINLYFVCMFTARKLYAYRQLFIFACFCLYATTSNTSKATKTTDNYSIKRNFVCRFNHIRLLQPRILQTKMIIIPNLYVLINETVSICILRQSCLLNS